MNKVSTATVNNADIADMLVMLQTWHASRIQQIQGLLDAEDDVAIVLRGTAGKELEIKGDARRGFKAGIRLAKEMFTPLPMRIEAIDREEDKEEA